MALLGLGMEGRVHKPLRGCQRQGPEKATQVTSYSSLPGLPASSESWEHLILAVN